MLLNQVNNAGTMKREEENGCGEYRRRRKIIFEHIVFAANPSLCRCMDCFKLTIMMRVRALSKIISLKKLLNRLCGSTSKITVTLGRGYLLLLHVFTGNAIDVM